MSRMPIVWLAAFGLLALVGCQPTRPGPLIAEGGTPPADVARYAEARGRSERLRRGLDALVTTLRREGPNARLSGAWHERLREIKREYFSLRETFFDLALRHASAIVDRRDGRDERATLGKTALSLMAGTHLVRNFHALAEVLDRAPALRDVWDEADPAHGIQAGSWAVALEAYRNARYHDLFRQAMKRLEGRRRELERWQLTRDPAVVALFPDGLDAALAEARASYQLLRSRLAEENLGQDQSELETLVARSKVFRASLAAAAPTVRAGIARDGGLVRGDVHLELQRTKREYLELREQLGGLAFKHLGKLERPDLPYAPAFRLRAVGISLLAAMTLYDNVREIQEQLLVIPGVRSLMNQADPPLGIPRGFWDRAEREFLRTEFRTLLETGAAAIEEERGSATLEADPDLARLAQEILVSGGTTEPGRERGAAVAMAWAVRQWARRLDPVATLLMRQGPLKEGTTQLSKLIGTLIYTVAWRKGKLYDQADWLEFVRARLEPGDLLVERSPFRLTDKFIPGHFGHVAMYVGTEDDLRRLGLWEHPRVVPYRRQVAEGRTVVEALREGTQMNTLAHFLNIDDLVIMRPKPAVIPRRDVVLAIALAFSHVGKKYDFAFDNNTWDAIVCSELAFQTYVNVRWPFARVLSSYTIAPDDVAVLAGSDASRAFELVAFIHDGRVVHDRTTGLTDEAAFAALLGTRYMAAGR